MNLEEAADGTLVVTYDGRALTKLMLVATALFVGVAGYDLFVGARGTDRLVGLLGASATCLIVSIVFLETARFEFAISTHLITWRRRWGSASAQGRSHSVRYSRSWSKGRWIADQIRAVLGHNADETRSDDVAALVAAGKTIEAIKILRETEGLSLTDAKQRVDDLRRKASSR